MTPGQVPVVNHIHLDSPVVLDMRPQLVLEVSHIHPHALQGPGVTHTHHCSQVLDSLVQACYSLAWAQACDSWAWAYDMRAFSSLALACILGHHS